MFEYFLKYYTKTVLKKNNHTRPILLFLLFVLAITPALGQTGRARFSIETSLYRGVIWRHTPKLTTQTGETLWGEELGIRVQTLGRRPWQAWQRYPVFGLSVSHFRLGPGSHGDVYGLLPSLTVPVLRRDRWLVGFRVGTGLGWVTRPYDYFDNPGQNAIGSHWNNFTQFRLSGEVRLNAHWRVLAGASLNHFSNGAGALPNFGINLPAGFASAVWQPKALRTTDFQPASESRNARRRFGGEVQTGLARVEYVVFDGPKYPIRIFSAAGHFYFNRLNRLTLGLDYERNEAVAQWAWHVGNYRERADARRAAQRLALTLGDEFLFGNLGVQLQAGYYLGGTMNQYVLNAWYSKLTTRFYFPPLFGTALRPQAGISLKAHKAVAEYISFNVGLTF